MTHPTLTIRSGVNTSIEDLLGIIPLFLDDADPRPAKEQLDEKYAHGGGFRHLEGFKMLPNGDLKYPGDEPTRFLAHTYLRDEKIIFYEHAWVAIVQPDGSFEVSRLD
ncbi:MAG: hypothetical protein KKH61_21240 [Gammaproteobacteria bacterium]|uniref:Uncharacterized protein n=1 Tax=viral metagenome TaxID=1070528 RepID=A0A6H1ZAZ5_9ZZZZ|nr:hypothetical protein [Gammaproteobacteria bacterium]